MQPRTSKGITDLLLPHFHPLNVDSPFKKCEIGAETSRFHKAGPAPPLRACRDLTKLHPYRRSAPLVNKLRSRSLSELTRQITPPTKNGHAPPPIEIKKELSICQSSPCLDLVSFPVLSQIKPQAPLLVCSSVNSFKFQPCDHTPPRTQIFNGFPSSADSVVRLTTADP